MLLKNDMSNACITTTTNSLLYPSSPFCVVSARACGVDVFYLPNPAFLAPINTERLSITFVERWNYQDLRHCLGLKKQNPGGQHTLWVHQMT